MKPKTVKELREFFDTLPDDLVVLVPAEDHSFGIASFNLEHVTKEGKTYVEPFAEGDVDALVIS